MSVTVAIRDFTTGGWVHFPTDPHIIRADRLVDVLPALKDVERLIQHERLFAVGFVSYEASSAFDEVLTTKAPAPSFPLLYFALCDRLTPLDWPEQVEEQSQPSAYRLTPWQVDVPKRQFQEAIARIKQYILQGDTYQVNYTFRLRSQFEGDTWALFRDLVAAQNTPYCTYIEAEDFAVCSASPELFFKQVGDRIELRPMKGTVARGRTLEEDRARQQWLCQSPKDQAENLMIVDMIRNDVGRIAAVGSVRVPKLFEIERYPSIHQMTSTVTATVRTPLTETVQTLFPCASITGAPKARTMEIITELETSPRKLYTGSIGLIHPNGAMQFNVAIRTVLVNKVKGEAEYGVGSGIVWDSTSDREYVECLEKSKVLTHRQPHFALLESILWEPGSGYFLLDAHLDRMRQSAEYFQIHLDRVGLNVRLQQLADTLHVTCKVRVTLSTDGVIDVTVHPLDPLGVKAPVQLAIARHPIRSNDSLLFHKTTHRDLYRSRLAEHPQAHDVILWNERGEITEGCWGNIAIKRGKEWMTPPVGCGLLAGVYRQHAIASGKLQETIISVDELKQCDGIAWFNSVRKWHDAILG
ncbi:MAG: aminodeoxychorismate synthase component I [Synechococcus sp.]